MFDLIRNHKRWMLFLVLILILPSFVFFGIEGYSRFMGSDPPMATVAGEPITRAEYDAVRRDQLDRGRQMFGAAFDPSVFDNPLARRQTLDQIIDTRVMDQAMLDGYLTVSDTVVREAIAQTPAVQRNGRFDVELYTQILAAQGMTPGRFEAGLRYELARALVLEPVADSGLVSTRLVEDLLAQLERERTVRVREFGLSEYQEVVTISADEVQAYYEANAQAFQVPQTVDAEYLLLDSDVVLREISVSDADIAQYYEQNQHRFVGEDRRQLRHILIADADDAEARIQALAEELAADPGRFAELAREHSDDPGSAADGGSLGWITPGALVPEFEEVAFTLEAGEVSPPVQTDFGWHLIRADAVETAAVRPLEEVRDQLANEIRMQLGGARFGDLASQMTNLVYDQFESLEPAADALNLDVRRVAGVQRTAVPASAPDWFEDPRILQALFSSDVLREGRNSGVIELAPDQLVAVRVVESYPAHTAPLADVEAEIRDLLTQERALAAAREAGETLLADLRAGSLAADEAGFGPEMQVSRAEPAALGQWVIDAIMSVTPEDSLPAFVGAEDGSAYVIAEVSAIDPLPEPSADAVRAEWAGLAAAQAEAEVQAALRQLRLRYDVTIEPLAERVIQEGDETS